MNSERLRRRLRELHARAAIQRWEVRQLRHAGGVWVRLTLLLATARRALIITDENAAALEANGFAPHPVGNDLEPPKSIFVIPEERLPASIQGHEIPLQDLQQILLARALVLIPFE